MGEVYLARQKSLSRQVALKVLRPDLVSNPTSIARFKAEARAAARINHPNIVHIYAFDSVGEIRFIAMEYVPGTNLREYLSKHGKLPLSVAMAIMLQTARAAGAAGDRGLVHRDIKPDNILLTKNQMIKVADFGLCRDRSNQSNLTLPGTTMGTPLYMSPEQCQGKELDHRSDLYSLGVTYYHMLAGEPPFRAESPLALALKHINETPVDLGALRPDLPPSLVAAVARLMAKSPDERYQKASVLIEDLERIRKGESIPSPSLTFGAGGLTMGAVSAPDLATTAGDAVVSKPADFASKAKSQRLLVACLSAAILGGWISWVTRPEDLLGPNAPAPEGPPGLWLDPDWESIPKRHGAEAQYRQAQLASSSQERTAAWLAVPGHFRDAWIKVDGNYSETHRNQHYWSLLAYIQVIRDLWRAGDRERLSALADEFNLSRRADDKRLGAIGKAAVAVLSRQYDESLELLADALPKDDNLDANAPARGLRPRLQQSLSSSAKIDMPLYELIAEILRDAIVDPEFSRDNETAINELFEEVGRKLDVAPNLLKRRR